MKKPTDLAIWMYKNWPIHGIRIRYQQIETEKAVTEITVLSAGGQIKMTDEQFDSHCVLRRDYNSICDLKPSLKEDVTNYLNWELENAKDLAEFERLKKKLNQ